jgi:small subunit ribosomal protein S6
VAARLPLNNTRFLSRTALGVREDGEKMQRTYEVMFIVRPDLQEEDVDKLITTLQTHVTNAGAQVQNAEKMGKRRLAYDVRKFSEGMYVLLTLIADGKTIHELERRLRVTEQVIKFITVRTDEEQQRLDKVRKLRESRAKRPPAEAATPAETENPAVSA